MKACGTPYFRGHGLEQKPSSTTFWTLSDKDENIHRITVSPTPQVQKDNMVDGTVCC